MTDPKTLVPGDKLIFTARAEQRRPGGWLLSFRDHVFTPFFSDDAVRHAKHLSAPKVFKRGDWVRVGGSYRHGLVLENPPRGLCRVHWPDGHIMDEVAEYLEPDEAPE